MEVGSSYIPSEAKIHKEQKESNHFNSPPVNQHDIINKNKQHLNSQFVREVKKYYISETIKLSIATGPLYIIAGQMQYLTNNNSKQAFKFNYFDKYYSLSRHMFNQGFFGLYKGNCTRLTFFISSVYLKQSIEDIYNTSIAARNIKIPKIMKEIFFYSIADIILNPLLFIESRLMLQNKNKGFRHYSGILNTITSSYREIYKGSILSIYRNFMFVVGINLYFVLPSTFSNYLSILLSHLLSYPFLTIQRNILLRSNTLYFENELVIKENKGLFRINEIIEYFKIFGIAKLYRGFGFYLGAVGLWHYYVPPAAKYKYYKNLL